MVVVVLTVRDSTRFPSLAWVSGVAPRFIVIKTAAEVVLIARVRGVSMWVLLVPSLARPS